MRFITPPLLAALAWLLAAGPAGARYDYRVVGVPKGDTLNMRERVDDPSNVTSAKIVGRIDPGASDVRGTGSSRLLGKTRWYEVVHDGVRGWVNGKFLSPLAVRSDTHLEGSLNCFGTEPFWSLIVRDNMAKYDTPETQSSGASLRFNIYERRLDGPRRDRAMIQMSLRGTPASAVVTAKEWCSDGMSDFSYGFSAELHDVPEPGKTLRGCCVIAR
ncbi:MAG: COG3650 family protein [Hyphomicrobiaceae bacterium]